MSLASNLRHVRDKIEQVARSCGRDSNQIELLAVSKTFPADVVEIAYGAGQRLFGENRVQEAEAKIPKVQAPGARWHLIGHLQSNKARRAVELFDVIETVDSEKIARKIDGYCLEQGKKMRMYIQVNLGEESHKSGLSPEEAVELVRVVDSLENLRLEGLMTMPPYHEDPDHSRPYFRALRELLLRINQSRKQPLQGLSMGMSNDYSVAIEEGSTLLRIGTAISGPRE